MWDQGGEMWGQGGEYVSLYLACVSILGSCIYHDLKFNTQQVLSATVIKGRIIPGCVVSQVCR